MSDIGEQRKRQAWAAHGLLRTTVKHALPMTARILAAELDWHLNHQNHAIADPAVVEAITRDTHEIVRLLGQTTRKTAM